MSDGPRVAVTGTPGTGKTTTTTLLDGPVIHLNDLIREAGLWSERDEGRGSLVADLDAVREAVGDWSGVAESHLAHHLDADRVVVLRCRPDTLERRLRERGADEAKATENAESEALDVILSEAVERHGLDSVYEVDTTDRTPADVAADIEAVVTGDRGPSAGDVEFTDYL
ncbi:adenylate kinase [Haloplanus salinus]|uniref:Putative adenylate kinase n=1 Tax=Haloplanus salinus TaxID=1126245 RepID=A0A368N9M9_9EURY|nr:adenylate kinase family protein [Haloplanus salinus]RCU46255.1 adenylate kinase [Haloplanus salinus]